MGFGRGKQICGVMHIIAELKDWSYVFITSIRARGMVKKSLIPSVIASSMFNEFRFYVCKKSLLFCLPQ